MSFDLIATIAQGVPPIGRGYYARSGAIRGPFQFAFVNASRSDYGDIAAACRALGQQVWLYMTPEKWHPDTWRAGLSEIRAKRAAVGATGFVADSENGWRELARDARRTQLAAFGHELGAAATECRVGVTSFPDFPDIDVLAAAAGPAIFGSPQEYGQDAGNRAIVLAAWWSNWRRSFGARLMLSFAAWPANAAMSNSQGYYAYLHALPQCASACGWTEGEIPNYMLAALASYEPGGSSLGTIAHAIEAVIARPAMAAVAAVVLILVVVAISFYKVRYA